MSNDDIVGVRDGRIGYENAENAARISSEDGHL